MRWENLSGLRCPLAHDTIDNRRKTLGLHSPVKSSQQRFKLIEPFQTTWQKLNFGVSIFSSRISFWVNFEVASKLRSAILTPPSYRDRKRINISLQSPVLKTEQMSLAFNETKMSQKHCNIITTLILSLFILSLLELLGLLKILGTKQPI